MDEVAEVWSLKGSYIVTSRNDIKGYQRTTKAEEILEVICDGIVPRKRRDYK